MKTIKMEVALTYENEIMHDTSTKDRNEFFRHTLMGEGLELFCREMGDTIGKVKVISITMPIPKNKNKNDKKEVQLDL